MKQFLKRLWFRLLGKDPEAVVVCFRSGDEALSDAMCEEIRRLEPARRHFEVRLEEAAEVRRKFRGYRVGLTPVLFTDDDAFRTLRLAAFRLAPTKMLAYNARLERHHLKLSSPIASWLFLRGVPLDRIFLRPWWLVPWRKDRTIRPAGHRVIEGRPVRKRTTVAILTPYFPFPLSHGGAVRIFHLLREMAREFDVTLYVFTEGNIPEADVEPVLALVNRVYFVAKPRYREPRWSSLSPPEAGEYFSPEIARLWQARSADVSQVEYTYLANYGGDILVEHDVTFDLYAQVLARKRTRSAWWDWWRWRRFETRVVRQFGRVVVMSEKDRALLPATTAVIENGVDLQRFVPVPESPGRRLLFIGSFRHFPNIVAFRFLTEDILQLVSDVDLTVVAGPDPWLHWRNFTGTLHPPEIPRIQMLEFVADVRPLYHEANLVLIPTLESAGTNVKVLEALAMQRAVVSTPSGCAGLGLEHRTTAWIAESASGLAEGITTLLGDSGFRERLAAAGRAHARSHLDWRAIGRKQRALLRELAGDPLQLRRAAREDLDRIADIQKVSAQAAQWEPGSLLEYDCTVAAQEGRVVAFLASRQTAPGEREILNLAVSPESRRRGVALRLIEAELNGRQGSWFLEVRESNAAAIRLYESCGFNASGRREKYYSNPVETAIVMRFLS
jgi:ribosomal protein S18 acetylase RimI-like enzyme